MRSKKALINLITSLLLQIVTATTGFILTRYFITIYSSTINGVVSSIRQFVNYISIVEAGVGMASIVALYSPLAAKNMNQINAILSGTRIFYKRSGYIFAVLITALAFIYPLIINNQATYLTGFLLVLILGGSGVTEFFIIGKYRVLLTADQKNYVVSLVQIIATIINVVVSVTFMKLGYHIITVQIVGTAIFVSRAILLTLYVKKRYSHINYHADPDMRAIDKKWDVLIHQVAGLVVNNTPIILLTLFSSLKEVSVYSVYFMVTYAVYLVVTSFNNGLMGGFGDIISRNDLGALKKSFRTYEYVYYAVLTWAYTCTGILLLPFISIYSQGFHDANYTRPIVAILFIFVGVANNVRVPPMTIINAAGHFRETRYRALTEAVINLTVSLILVQFYGVVGVLFGSICSFAYRTTDFILYTSRRLLKDSPKKTFHSLAINALLSMAGLVIFLVIFPVRANTFYEWIEWACIISIACFILIFSGNIIADPSNAKELWARISNIIRKKHPILHK